MSEATFEERAEVADGEVGYWPEVADAKPPRSLPTFPTDLLPPVLGNMAEGAAAEIQAPIDIAAMLILAVASSTLAGKVQFVGRAGHHEHAMIWCWTCAASAERKTPVFNLLREPLTELERQHAVAAARSAAVNEIKLEILEADIKALKKGTNAGNMDSKQADLEGLVARRQALTDPGVSPCAWVTSPTPEGLHGVMASNGGRVAVFSDEGGIVGILAGRYSSKGAADLDPFLSGYVGSPLKSPRASRDRVDVPAAYLTMGLAVQPSVLEELAEIGGAEDRGLIGRFLFALPESMVGDRMYDDSIPVKPEVARSYATAITAWAEWPGSQDGRILRVELDEQAFRTYAKFHDDLERRNKPDAEGSDLAAIPTWGGKIAGTTLRLAGLMHCYGRGVKALQQRVESDTVQRAIDLTNGYLIPHAKAAFEDMEQAGARTVKRRILSWIAKDKDVTEFRLRDLFQGLKSKRGTVKHVNDLQPALDQMVAENYIRETNSDRSDSTVYEVNPRWDRAIG